MCTVHDELRFLLASDNRTAALNAMASDGPLDRATLDTTPLMWTHESDARTSP